MTRRKIQNSKQIQTALDWRTDRKVELNSTVEKMKYLVIAGMKDVEPRLKEFIEMECEKLSKSMDRDSTAVINKFVKKTISKHQQRILESVKSDIEKILLDAISLYEIEKSGTQSKSTSSADEIGKSNVYLQIERDNEILRSKFLDSVPTYSIKELQKLTSTSKTECDKLLKKWKSQKCVFSIPIDGNELFPQFQFEAGKPKKIIKRILTSLSDSLIPWQIAFWFVTNNGWLDNESPHTSLDDTDSVLLAAQRTRELAVG